MLYLTYEELKRFGSALQSLSSSNVVPYLWGIETKCSFYISHGVLRCTLPMRNWNSAAVFVLLFCAMITVVPYLWGIETCHKNEPYFLPSGRFVVPYLWGIETCCSFSSWVPCAAVVVPYLWGIETLQYYPIEFHILGCTLPMRNWNPITYLLSVFGKSLFQNVVPYLWGIETIPGLHIEDLPIRRTSLYLTYEELKRSLCCSCSFVLCRLYLTYEELKHNTVLYVCLLSSNDMLYLTYEELKHL